MTHIISNLPVLSAVDGTIGEEHVPRPFTLSIPERHTGRWMISRCSPWHRCRFKKHHHYCRAGAPSFVDDFSQGVRGHCAYSAARHFEEHRVVNQRMLSEGTLMSAKTDNIRREAHHPYEQTAQEKVDRIHDLLFVNCAQSSH